MDTVQEDTDPAPPEASDMETTPLTALDRCDRCGAQAYVRVTLHREPIDLVNGITRPGELLFCAHHANLHRDQLTEVAERFHDERSRLKEGT